MYAFVLHKSNFSSDCGATVATNIYSLAENSAGSDLGRLLNFAAWFSFFNVTWSPLLVLVFKVRKCSVISSSLVRMQSIVSKKLPHKFVLRMEFERNVLRHTFYYLPVGTYFDSQLFRIFKKCNWNLFFGKVAFFATFLKKMQRILATLMESNLLWHATTLHYTNDAVAVRVTSRFGNQAGHFFDMPRHPAALLARASWFGNAVKVTLLSRKCGADVS